MRRIGGEESCAGFQEPGTKMLTATAKNRKEGEREGRENFFFNLLFSPPPPNEVLRVGAGLKAEEAKDFNSSPGGL